MFVVRGILVIDDMVSDTGFSRASGTWTLSTEAMCPKPAVTSNPTTQMPLIDTRCRTHSTCLRAETKTTEKRQS